MIWRSFIIVLLGSVPFLGLASNAGIVQGLWFNDDTFFANDTVRVYVAVRNYTGSDLSGTVEFFVNEKKIERRTIDVLDGRIIESWADWKASYGTSTVRANLIRTEISSTETGTETIAVTSALAEATIFVDHDTDGDDIGDTTDLDDDNDGVSDEEEIKAGSDPLTYDEPEEPEDESSDTGSETNDDADDNGNTPTNNHTSGNPEGLEQYLTPSRADTLLSSFTEGINTTKRNLDSYIETRSDTLNSSRTGAETDIAVNEDGFGAIERISGDKKNEPVAETPDLEELGFFGDVLAIIGKIISVIYTVVLSALSFTLGYPALIQILLLFLLLFAIFRLAKKLGGRPS